MKAIHWLLLLFSGPCLSPLASAQAGTTLLVKTDATCNWKLDGQAMGQLRADRSTVVLVTPGEHLVEATATEGVATLRNQVKVDQTEQTVAIQLRGRSDQQSRMLPAPPLKKLTAAEAAQNPTWTDPTTGLMWTGKDNGSDVDWRKADTYCRKLQYAGFDGWRLPTTEELQSIFDLKVKTHKTFATGMAYDIYIKGDIDITGNVWSGSPGRDLGQPYEGSWEFSFIDKSHSGTGLPNPFTNFTHFDFDMRALCVRQSTPQ